MKRLISLAIAITIAVVLTACGNHTANIANVVNSNIGNNNGANADANCNITSAANSPGATTCNETNSVAQSNSSALNAYKAVLQDKAEFFSTEANKNFNINQMIALITTENLITAVEKFVVIDLDYDGTPEVVLWLNVGGNDSLGFEILHYQDGVVYGFTFWYRAFEGLKSDGTFSVSSGAGDWGYCTVQFEKNTYTTDKYTYCKAIDNGEVPPVTAYFVNHKPATGDEFEAAASREIYDKADAAWVDFTAENIEVQL